VEAIPDHDIF
jgi:hypothetical protein